MMFPYPSAEGRHVGNVFAFTGADIHGRYRRLRGDLVFEPMGFDAFGIHSENFALKVGVHPAELTPRNIDRFRQQLQRVGLMVDWRHEVATTDPAYYRWTQWVFLQLYKAGLAVRKRGAVNWCPACKTVLANEQVINGYCERHPDTKVAPRVLEQWFFAITTYAERLLANLDTLDWSSSTRALQANWIGRSEGTEAIFETPTGHRIAVFTRARLRVRDGLRAPDRAGRGRWRGGKCWERLGHGTSVMDAAWPAFDATLALDEQVEIIVQVNGKVRGRIAVPRGIGEAAAVAAAKTEGAVRTAIHGKEVRKVVFVPDRVVNLVIA